MEESLHNDNVKVSNLKIVHATRIDTADNTAYDFLIVDQDLWKFSIKKWNKEYQ